MPQPTKAQLAKIAADYRREMVELAHKAPDQVLIGYRADPKSPTGIESMPTYFHKQSVIDTANAMRNMQDIGGKTLSPQDYTNLLLHEGRSDAGFNELDKNNKEANYFARQLYDMGHEDRPADTAAAIHQKLQESNRLKIPFGEAWNGTGKSHVGSGKEYAQKLEAAKSAVMHPANQNLFDTVQNVLKPSEWNNLDLTPVPDMKFNQGGIAMPSEYTAGSWKLI